ncbi:MAG: 3-oxoacid CoA-transferase subunit B [Proteobacteria bacterium]|nr:3-oxoacid CoA-transferase subunit B [Pseudomonadota bacterium]
MRNVPQLSVEQAAELVSNGDTLLVGGFGMTGNPVHLLHAIAETNVKNLTYVGNNIGEAGLGGGRLLRNGQIDRVIGSYFTSNREAVAAAQSGEISIELLPQGTLAEALRAGGAGIGGFFTPTSAATPLAEGRETRELDGRTQVFQPAIRGNIALIRAWKADAAGNLQYRMTESNFNQPMATAADLVIAEVEHIVEVGDLDPNHIHTPGCFVDYLVEAHTSLEDLGSSASIESSRKKVDPMRMAMAEEALAELKPGAVVNLGIGIPTLVADLITPEHRVILHTENGMLGVGPEPQSGGAMDYPVNAGKIPVTALPGSSYFDSPSSFALIRGGHVDVAIMGGLQVDQHGNLANWTIPGKPLLGVGGAMDLAYGANKLIITMTHKDRSGRSKVVADCTLPLTAAQAVDVLITDLGVFRFADGAMTLTKTMPDISLEEIRANTDADFAVAL